MTNPLGLDVGTANVVHGITQLDSQTQITIYDKELNQLSQFVLATQMNPPAGPCSIGGGQPTILFDHLSQRWLIMERAEAGNNTLCLYVSNSPVATSIATNYMFYEISTPIDPDFPKLAMFNDFFTVTLNLASAGPFPGPPFMFIERQPLIDFLTTRVFTVDPIPALIGYSSLQSFTAANVEKGSPQPDFAGAVFMRHNDDEIHGGVPDGSNDFLDVTHFITANFDTR